ncbi:ADP-ribosylglycohydrolase [Acrocarpospora corrugata]|uniref:ADP-ribosylglycohydrolase n=1 Tax=Acrocarpospora corrugata TaxID=35763 RepID=A0A5M3VTR3_9ACTN|nr:ADP-ribosylglycohydrolase family protein [Acrocarpospora corrugata]GER99913.1 ADP-ribosylglycohydrolase [Acrocarpospora corrugata]
MTITRQVAAAIRGAVAGDALGVPWETAPPERVDRDRLFDLPSSRGWPAGTTSDDTSQLMIVARLLAGEATPTAGEFLRRLAAEADQIRGMGSTTRRALRNFAAGEPLPEISPQGRATNGAAMRIAPAGWVVPPGDPARRRALVTELSGGTHPHPVAIGAASIVSAMASQALDDATGILPAAVAEADHLGLAEFEAVRRAAAGTWTPPLAGIPTEAATTVAAVVHSIRHSTDLVAAQIHAVTLGGDTDTVAAIVGGILGGVPGQPVPPWWPRVRFPEDAEVDALAARLAAVRAL